MHLVYRLYGCQIMLKWRSCSHVIRRTNRLQVILRALSRALKSTIASRSLEALKLPSRKTNTTLTWAQARCFQASSQPHSIDQLIDQVQVRVDLGTQACQAGEEVNEVHLIVCTTESCP